ELPHAGSNHFAVERVDLLDHGFGYGRRVEVVGEVVTNQVLWHESLLYGFTRYSGGPVARLHQVVERLDRKSTECLKNFSAAPHYAVTILADQLFTNAAKRSSALEKLSPTAANPRRK